MIPVIEVKTSGFIFSLNESGLFSERGITKRDISHIKMYAKDIQNIRISGNDINNDMEDTLFIDCHPLFFDDVIYEVFTDLGQDAVLYVVPLGDESKKRECEKTSSLGITYYSFSFNFCPGFYELILKKDYSVLLKMCIEVFPDRTEYKDDHKNIMNSLLNDIFLFNAEKAGISFDRSITGNSILPETEDHSAEYLDVISDIFKNSNKEISALTIREINKLYEYWCFIKIMMILNKNYSIITSNGSIGMTEGTVFPYSFSENNIEAEFINNKTGEKIIISYSPLLSDTQTVKKKAGIVLTLEKRGTSIKYRYLFMPSYRICTKDGSANEADINEIHACRDSIVYENPMSERFIYAKKMFGAYILFPGNDKNADYTGDKFYKSIESVNIGALPFLPGNEKYVEDFLNELIEDSELSAFERNCFPEGIEEKLIHVDWSVKDVMIGTVRSQEQLEYNINDKCYYAPAKYVPKNRMPVRYIALYEDQMTDMPGIKNYGEILQTMIVRRKHIPVPSLKNNPEELYYYFKVREWIPFEEPIKITDTSRGRPKFTNKFLLDNCRHSYQLVTINNDEQYRLMKELENSFEDLKAQDNEANEPVYRINDKYFIVSEEDSFSVTDADGNIISKIPHKTFMRHPRITFNKIKRIVSL